MDIEKQKKGLNKYTSSARYESNDNLGKETNNRIVGYSVSGDPLTKKDYINKVLKAENSITKGECINHNDLKKDIENW